MNDQAPEQRGAFLSYVRSIDVDRHILKGKRGSEENVKIKVVVPLLEALGWDVLEDMDFEHRGADIVLHTGGEPGIVVEVKSWREEITGYLDQCLEYCLKLGTHFVLITSAEDTALYSSLLNPRDLHQTGPLCRFSFLDLVGDNGESILDDLASLIGKEAFTAPRSELSARVEDRLDARGLSEARDHFDQLASDFEPELKAHRLSLDQFMALSAEHPEAVRNGLETMYNGIVELSKLDERLQVRSASTSIGLVYRLEGRPRTTTVGLVGVYPERARISHPVRDWRRANIPGRLCAEFDKYPGEVRSREWAEGLLELLRQAILEIT